ncbi:unnamed protein product, partial [Polarella glacialis]
RARPGQLAVARRTRRLGRVGSHRGVCPARGDAANAGVRRLLLCRVAGVLSPLGRARQTTDRHGVGARVGGPGRDD